MSDGQWHAGRAVERNVVGSSLACSLETSSMAIREQEW